MDELGDWIPVGIDLYRKPKFVALCRAMQASRFEAAGRVLAVWFWIQSYGPQTALDASGVDEAAAVPPGTTEALIASGWATASRRSGGGIRFSWPGETLAEIRNRRSASARRAASARWHGGPTDADAMRPHSDCNAKSKSKSESKSKTESLEPIGSRLVQADAETPSARTDRRRRQPREDSIGWSASNGFAGVTDADRTAWSAAYPAVDLDAELAKAHAWLAAASPSERWRNVRSGLRRWMARSQGYADRRGNANGLTGPTPRRILPLGCYFDADGIARTASGARLD